jgi:hypothetical protein
MVLLFHTTLTLLATIAGIKSQIPISFVCHESLVEGRSQGKQAKIAFRDQLSPPLTHSYLDSGRKF